MRFDNHNEIWKSIPETYTRFPTLVAGRTGNHEIGEWGPSQKKRSQILRHTGIEIQGLFSPGASGKFSPMQLFVLSQALTTGQSLRCDITLRRNANNCIMTHFVETSNVSTHLVCSDPVRNFKWPTQVHWHHKFVMFELTWKRQMSPPPTGLRQRQ